VLDQAVTNSIAAAYRDAFAATLGSVNGLSSHWSPVSLTLKDITTATGPEFLSAVGGAGSSGGKDLPAQCALVTKLNTALRGRSFRGRHFWPGIPESAVTANQADTFLVAQIESFWVDFQTRLTAVSPSSDLQVAVISRKLKQIHSVTGYTTSQKVFTQRRRAKHV
jgi:hypothetical protein